MNQEKNRPKIYEIRHYDPGQKLKVAQLKVELDRTKYLFLILMNRYANPEFREGKRIWTQRRVRGELIQTDKKSEMLARSHPVPFKTITTLKPKLDREEELKRALSLRTRVEKGELTEEEGERVSEMISVAFGQRPLTEDELKRYKETGTPYKEEKDMSNDEKKKAIRHAKLYFGDIKYYGLDYGSRNDELEETTPEIFDEWENFKDSHGNPVEKLEDGIKGFWISYHLFKQLLRNCLPSIYDIDQEIEVPQSIIDEAEKKSDGGRIFESGKSRPESTSKTKNTENIYKEKFFA